jgi:hypothetical protein
MSFYEKPLDICWVRSCTALRPVRCVSSSAHGRGLGLQYTAGDRFPCTFCIDRGDQKDPSRTRTSTSAISLSCPDIRNVCKPVSTRAPVKIVSNRRIMTALGDRHTLTSWQSLSLMTHSSQGQECSSSRRLHLAPIAMQSKQPLETG